MRGRALDRNNTIYGDLNMRGLKVNERLSFKKSPGKEWQGES